MKDPVEIIEVKNQQNLRRFVKFAYTLYKDNPYWIPPLIRGELETLSRKKNPAFEHCEAVYFLARKNNRIVGRIAGITNRLFVEKWEKRWARFSWLDFIDDEEVSQKLLEAVENWAKSKGMEGLLGPMGFSTFERQGMQVEGFEKLPTFVSTYNYPYYSQHLEKQGYSKQTEYVEYEVKTPAEVPEKAIKLRNLILERYHLKTLSVKNKKEMLPYGRQVFQIINEAYKPLFGFVPLTEKQIVYYLKKYTPFLFPDYISAVLDQQDQLIGFLISIPSLSKAFQKARGRLFPFGYRHFIRAFKNPDRLDLLLVAIHPNYQSKGLNSVFMTDLTINCIKKGIRWAESNQELEDNLKVQNIWKHFDATQYKRSLVYFKSL